MQIDIHPTILQALKSNQPVVALESTIITHGMEYPTNYQTALAVEKCIQDQGAIPATIAILKGVIKVGLTNDQIHWVAENKDKFTKCSRRDLAYILTNEGYGSTTVAATMICAHRAGIKVFVTGGIGGVHRGAEQNFDISADLLELGQTPVAVISAGAKSILDIPKTLEYLETQGVPVLGYQTKQFPDFFTNDSGYECSHKVDNAEQAAQIIRMQFDFLQFKNGLLIANPVPKEEEANNMIIKQAIDKAIEECNQQKIEGAKITPFLLKRINELTEGDSNRANVALIKNNAVVGAQISVQLSKLMKL